MRIIRSTLVVAAAFLAACGDKVTVPVAPTTTVVTTTAAPKVNSVAVTPSVAAMNIGDKIILVAAVNADAGLATTVTWASSDATKATVDASGNVTAVAATAGVAICATSTVDTGKKGCAAISVAAAGVVVPAAVRITSITVGNLNVPVNNAAVAGPINVSMTVSPGTQTVTKVALTLNGVEVDNQTFTSTQSAALRGAADQAVATQSSFPTIVFYVNTAAYNTTTGVPAYKNGTYTVGANLYTKAGGAAVANSASYASPITFVNVDGFQVSLVPNTAVAAGIVDANGYRWFGNGTLTINAIPVMYSGLTVGTVNASLSTAGGCAVGGTGTTSSATTATAGVWANILTLVGSQTPIAGTCNTTGPNTPVITAADNNGNSLTLGGTNGVLNAQAGIRWDNVAPAAPVFTGGATTGPNGRSNGWINDAVSFNTIQAAGNLNGYIAAAVTDAGVGLGGSTGTTYAVLVGSNAAGTVNAAKTGTTLTNSLTLAQTPTATAGYCGLARAYDALGNASALPAAGTGCTIAGGAAQIAFGVDRVAPIVTVNGAAGNAKSLRMFSTTTANISWTLSDTSINAAAATIALTGRATRYGSAAADTVFFIPGTTAGDPVPAGTTTFTLAGNATNGYWTVTMAGSDQAGNSVTVPSYVYLQDNTPATLSLALQTNAGLTSGNAESFYATAADNVDLDSAYVTHSLGDGATGAIYPFMLSATKIQSAPFLAGAPIKTAAVTGAWPAMPRQINTVASGAAISTGSAGFPFAVGAAIANDSNVTFWVTDQTNDKNGTLDAGSTANAAGTLGYKAVNLPAGAAWTGLYTASTVTITSSAVAAAATLHATCTATNTRCADTVTVVVNLTGQVTPPTAAPIGRAELWTRTNAAAAGASSAASKGFQLINSSATPVPFFDGQAQVAKWTYTYIFTPTSANNLAATPMFYGFVGYDSKFNAIITPSAAVTVAP